MSLGVLTVGGFVGEFQDTNTRSYQISDNVLRCLPKREAGHQRDRRLTSAYNRPWPVTDHQQR
jgi:hypothetical protein